MLGSVRFFTNSGLVSAMFPSCGTFATLPSDAMKFWGRRNAAAEIVRVLGDGCVGDPVCGVGGREALGIRTSDGVIDAGG